VSTLFPISLSSFKSPWRCLARSFYLSRNRWKRNAQDTGKQLQQCQQECREAKQELKRQLEIHSQLVAENRALRSASAEAPAKWKVLPGHQFSAEMICLCCLLSLLVGFRAVPKVIKCFATIFGLKIEVPSRDAVRNWGCRNGVAILEEPRHADDWVWMIDHSVQLGKMFVLVVLGIRQREFPSGRVLRREDMSVLAVLPTSSRSKHEVARQLAKVSESFGAPMAVLSDGAPELHEGVRLVENADFSPVHLDDIKHKIANLLKHRLKNCPHWKAFSAKLGSTTAAIQQTELEHLLPPRKREKGRFMDFGRFIDWAKMIEHQLAQTDSPNHKRIKEKLGWLTEFQSNLTQWSQYRHLISQSLQMANQEGVFAGASDELQSRLAGCEINDQQAVDFGAQIVSCYRHNEALLNKLDCPGLRLPVSTEVLESGFGSFKRLQGNHGRGTFTSLLSVFAAQFDHCTPAKIRKRFKRVTNKDVRTWLQQSNLTSSTQARRTAAYRAARSSVTSFSRI